MNSRQRRKIAAEQHNALLVEEEAYQEDRLRDPAKYSHGVSTGMRRSLANIAIATAATSIRFVGDE